MSSSQKHASGTATGAPAPKRMRVSRACEQCRSRKAKCDGTQPECSTCISLGQACSYGPPPKKRGLPPGSFSMLERTVKLFEKLLGLLFINVPGSDEVVLSLVQNYGKSLVDEEDDDEALTKAWKDGTVLKALEALQADNNNSETNNSKKMPRKSISSSSPGLETAQRLFKDASKAFPKPKELATPQSSGAAQGSQRGDMRRSFSDQFADVDWMGDMQQTNNNNTNSSNNNAEYDDTGTPEERNEGDEEQLSGPTPPITIDPLLMNSPAAFAPAPSVPTSLDPPIPAQLSLTSGPPNLAPTSMPQAALMSPPQTRRASQLASLPVARPVSKPDFPPNSKSLLDLYFTYTHSWFPILDKYDIIRLFHANKDRVGSSANPSSGNDTKRALLYAVLAVASLQRESLPTKSKRKAELATDTSDLYLRSQSILFTPGLAVSLETVQTLLLLSLVNISQTRLSTAWLLIGLAGRIAIELGLDYSTSNIRIKSRFAARAWLGYVVLEVFISNRLDREPQLNGVEWPLNGLEADGWEEWDSWKDVPVALSSRDNEELTDDDGRPAHILSVFNQLIAISKHVYDVSRLKTGQKDKNLKPQGNNIYVGLQSWVRGLPENFALNSTYDKNKPLTVLPHVVNLHAFYLNTVIQAHLYAGRQGSARSHHPSIPTAVTITLGRLQQLKSKWQLGVAPCTLLHFLEDITHDPIQEEINSQSRDSANALSDEMKENWRTSNPDTDTALLLRAVKDSAPAGPQDWFEAQLGPMGAALDIARPILNDSATLVAHSRAEIPIPFSPSHLFSSMGPPKSVSVPSPSALFNLPPSSSRARHNEQLPARPSSAYSSGGGNQFDEPRVTMGAQSSPSAIGIPSNLSQAAPSPDTFDEEMGMLECLPWAQEGIPEFIQNLGYVSGFSPSALQMGLGLDDQHQQHQQRQQPQPPHQQHPEDRGQQPQQEQTSAEMPSFLATTSAGDVEPTTGEDQSYSRHGLNTVLEQWLGDVYGAGHNVR